LPQLDQLALLVCTDGGSQGPSTVHPEAGEANGPAVHAMQSTDCTFDLNSARGQPMNEAIADTRFQLAVANRVIAGQGIIDAFGHISVRHPQNPERYLVARSRSPQLVTPEDILEYDLDSNPVHPTQHSHYSERVIHGAIYQQRPDVMCVCHHHAPAFMPLVITRTDYVPVFHLGAIGGIKPPFWDQREHFGDTNMLVRTAEEGRSLANALGSHWMVLMVRHGVTTAGRSIPENVFRCVFSCQNAEYQVRSMSIGQLSILSPGETSMAGKLGSDPVSINRAWEYWVHGLERSGTMPPPARA
jgi:ribulose-5-phosphate 4-epimerase/fuculose-1-phosphate aldolase